MKPSTGGPSSVLSVSGPPIWQDRTAGNLFPVPLPLRLDVVVLIPTGYGPVSFIYKVIGVQIMGLRLIVRGLRYVRAL
jgi:hypothetical protein